MGYSLLLLTMTVRPLCSAAVTVR